LGTSGIRLGLFTAGEELEPQSTFGACSLTIQAQMALGLPPTTTYLWVVRTLARQETSVAVIAHLLVFGEAEDGIS
jgi:hypothetical protein